VDSTREFDMRTSSRVLIVSAIFSATPLAWGAGGGGGSIDMPRARVQEQTPEQRAQTAYNSGVRMVKKADSQTSDAERQKDAAKREKGNKKANDAYRKALAKFEDAVSDAPGMHEAWNYIGYTKRRLGELDAALAAYDRALAIRPGYAQAIEYRGQAYLALHRIDEAKQAYLDLYAGNRDLSNQLLTAMQAWIGAQRASPSAPDAGALDELEQWIRERAAIASQTAALTREGTAASWN
jgi:tetratricopeptide (TPR) repeat protein